MSAMNVHFRFINVKKSYHMPMRAHHRQIFNTVLHSTHGIVWRDNAVKHRVQILTMMNMHGNVMRLLNINESKVRIHDTHSLRSIVLNNITQELMQT